jgi:hypothetical protein
MAQSMTTNFLQSVQYTTKTIKDDKITIVKKMKLLQKVKGDTSKYLKLKSNIQVNKQKLVLKIASAKTLKTFNNVSFTTVKDFEQYKPSTKTAIAKTQSTQKINMTKYSSKVSSFLSSL